MTSPNFIHRHELATPAASQGARFVNTRLSFALRSLIVASVVAPCAALAGGFSENFDGVTPPTLPAGWTAAVNTGVGSDIPWQTKAAGFASSAPNAAWVGDINDYADITLTTPVLTLGAGTSRTISFQQAYTLWAPDAGPLANGVYNGAVLEMSVNGGPFTDFVAAGGTFTAGGYNATLDPSFDNPLAQTPPLNRAVWGGASNGFVATTGTLPDDILGGLTIQFRWRLGTEGGGRGFDTYSGWWLDDFSCAACSLGIVDQIFANGFDP